MVEVEVQMGNSIFRQKATSRYMTCERVSLQAGLLQRTCTDQYYYIAGIFVGVSGGDGSSVAKPFAVWTPMPNQTYQVEPSLRVRVFMSRGARSGQILERDFVGDVGTADFRDQRDHKVTHTKWGEFSVE